jgi:hypothetical protein
MVHRKTLKRTFKKRRGSFINKTFKRGYKDVKYTSKKYMPKVKSGLESVGSKVTTTASKSVPFFKHGLFSMLGIKNKK